MAAVKFFVAAAILAFEPDVTPVTLRCHPYQYEGKVVSLNGTLVTGNRLREPWCLTDMRISVGNGVDLRFPSESMMAPFLGTPFVPRLIGAFEEFGGCDVLVTGLFAEDPDEPGHHILVVLDIRPLPERGM